MDAAARGAPSRRASRAAHTTGRPESGQSQASTKSNNLNYTMAALRVVGRGVHLPSRLSVRRAGCIRRSRRSMACGQSSGGSLGLLCTHGTLRLGERGEGGCGQHLQMRLPPPGTASFCPLLYYGIQNKPSGASHANALVLVPPGIFCPDGRSSKSASDASRFRQAEAFSLDSALLLVHPRTCSLAHP